MLEVSQISKPKSTAEKIRETTDALEKRMRDANDAYRFSDAYDSHERLKETFKQIGEELNDIVVEIGFKKAATLWEAHAPHGISYKPEFLNFKSMENTMSEVTTETVAQPTSENSTAKKVLTPEEKEFRDIRESLQKQFGRDIKIGRAITDKGSYNEGVIIKVNDKTVAQQLIKTKTIVVHPREGLSGDYVKGKVTNIEWKDGKGESKIVKELDEAKSKTVDEITASINNHKELEERLKRIVPTAEHQASYNDICQNVKDKFGEDKSNKKPKITPADIEAGDYKNGFIVSMNDKYLAYRFEKSGLTTIHPTQGLSGNYALHSKKDIKWDKGVGIATASIEKQKEQGLNR